MNSRTFSQNPRPLGKSHQHKYVKAAMLYKTKVVKSTEQTNNGLGNYSTERMTYFIWWFFGDNKTNICSFQKKILITRLASHFHEIRVTLTS